MEKDQIPTDNPVTQKIRMLELVAQLDRAQMEVYRLQYDNYELRKKLCSRGVNPIIKDESCNDYESTEEDNGPSIGDRLTQLEKDMKRVKRFIDLD